MHTQQKCPRAKCCHRTDLHRGTMRVRVPSVFHERCCFPASQGDTTGVWHRLGAEFSSDRRKTRCAAFRHCVAHGISCMAAIHKRCQPHYFLILSTSRRAGATRATCACWVCHDCPATIACSTFRKNLRFIILRSIRSTFDGNKVKSTLFHKNGLNRIRTVLANQRVLNLNMRCPPSNVNRLGD